MGRLPLDLLLGDDGDRRRRLDDPLAPTGGGVDRDGLGEAHVPGHALVELGDLPGPNGDVVDGLDVAPEGEGDRVIADRDAHEVVLPLVVGDLGHGHLVDHDRDTAEGVVVFTGHGAPELTGRLGAEDPGEGDDRCQRENPTHPSHTALLPSVHPERIPRRCRAGGGAPYPAGPEAAPRGGT